MTQSAQSERARTALNTSGITGEPLMSLERDDALFVLTDDVLVYQDGGGTRRVTLRDLTRIHSDQAGLLRVETPAGTALTASLLGFDVGQVQSFFKGVRSATARAKDLPDSPTPTLGGAKTFGAAPTAAGDASPRTAGADAEPQPGGPGAGDLAGAEARPESADGAASGKTTPPADTPTDTPPAATPPPENAATPKAPAAGPRGQDARAADSRKAGGSAENPVVISSSSFSPHVSKPGLGAGGTLDRPEAAKAEATKSDPTRPEASRPDLRKAGPAAAPGSGQPGSGQPSRPAARSTVVISGSASEVDPPERPAPAAVEPDAATPDAPPTPAPPVTALSKVAAATALARQAGTVEGLAGRLKVLALVLFVGALLLALFQFTGDQALAGLWTLLSGGVGAIALLALGEMSGLLALLARAPGPASETVTGGGASGEHDG